MNSIQDSAGQLVAQLGQHFVHITGTLRINGKEASTKRGSGPISRRLSDSHPRTDSSSGRSPGIACHKRAITATDSARMFIDSVCSKAFSKVP